MPVPVSFLSKVDNVYQNQGDFSINVDFTWRVSDCEELVGQSQGGQWLWFYGVSFFIRIGEARTKLMGIEEYDNGQGNRSMVN